MNDLRPSQRFARRKKAAPWWVTQFREHPFKNSSLVVLTIGGLMLLILFWHIGAMPELDLAGASATFAAVAILGLVVCACFCGSVLTGGLFLRSNTSFKYLSSTSGLFALSAPGVVFVGYLAIRWWIDGQWTPQVWLWYAPFFGSAVLALVMTPFWERQARTDVGDSKATGSWLRWGRIAAGFLATSCLWNVIALMAFLTLYALGPKTDGMHLFLARLVGWTLVCYFFNIGITRLPSANTARGILVVGGFALVALVGITSNISGIPMGVARGLGLGGDMPVGLVLSPEGCAILNSAARGRNVCNIQPSNSLGWACPVVLRSRIGSPFIVELSAFDNDGHWPRYGSEFIIAPIQIPKSEVRSWPSVKPMPAASAPWEQKTFHVVSYLEDRDLSAPQREWLEQQCMPPVKAGGAASAPAPSTSTSH